MRRPLSSTSVDEVPRPRRLAELKPIWSRNPPVAMLTPSVRLFDEAEIFDISSAAVVTPALSIASRVMICTGNAVSASMRLIAEPVTSTRCNCCCGGVSSVVVWATAVEARAINRACTLALTANLGKRCRRSARARWVMTGFSGARGSGRRRRSWQSDDASGSAQSRKTVTFRKRDTPAPVAWRQIVVASSQTVAMPRRNARPVFATKRHLLLDLRCRGSPRMAAAGSQ